MKTIGAKTRLPEAAGALALRQLPALLIVAVVYGGGFLAGFGATGLPRNFRGLATVEPESFWVFLGHNAPVLALTAAGALTGGLLTLLVLLFNGMLLGFTFAEAGRNGAIGDALAAVLPHAPLELAATLLAGAVGFMPASVVFRLALGRTVYVGRELADAGFLVAAALGFLTLAALVEASITPWVINWIVGGR